MKMVRFKEVVRMQPKETENTKELKLCGEQRARVQHGSNQEFREEERDNGNEARV